MAIINNIIITNFIKCGLLLMEDCFFLVLSKTNVTATTNLKEWIVYSG